MSGGDRIGFPEGGLAAAVEARTLAALACGALRPIETEQAEIYDGGVRFLVRVVSSLARKAEDRKRVPAGPPTNPFLPPEPELTVGWPSETHVAVLNKFNVLERHLLIVTRNFEYQETLLTPEDFHALFVCMAQRPSLGFYNGGALAGASQTHKHLQLVPLPLAPDGPAVPMAPLLAPLLAPGLTTAVGVCPGLPFRHVFGRLSRPVGADPGLVREAHGLYLRLLDVLGTRGIQVEGGLRQSAPYNLLVADDWLLAVPREAECFGSVSVNALGFAGSLFVKDRQRLAEVRDAGPMAVLRAVAGPA